MEQKIKNRLMCLLASFMVITSACSDNKSDIYVGQTPFGKNIPTRLLLQKCIGTAVWH